jgi:flagellar biosynthetic protein FlhB
MEDSEQDRTEQPTPFKLARGREKGTVARGIDLGFLTGLSAFLGLAWIAGPRFGASAANAMRELLIGAPQLADGPSQIFVAIRQGFAAFAGSVALMAAAIFAVVLLFEIIQTGPVFSTHPLHPDFSRLNPAKGLKRVFSIRLLIETAKNILKLCLYTTVGYLFVRGALTSDVGSVTDGHVLLLTMAALAIRLLAAFALVALFFATLDQLIVRRDFLRRMRMSRREIRRELREREGEPRLKQKRKQLHAEFVRLSRSVRNIKRADVLITNPEHIALALRYERKTMHAPIIISIGTNQFAQRLKRLAFIYGVPVVVNRALARALYRTALLDKPIAEEFFRPVADIYNAIAAAARRNADSQE